LVARKKRRRKSSCFRRWKSMERHFRSLVTVPTTILLNYCLTWGTKIKSSFKRRKKGRSLWRSEQANPPSPAGFHTKV
jgi:hypothetical protein